MTQTDTQQQPEPEKPKDAAPAQLPATVPPPQRTMTIVHDDGPMAMLLDSERFIQLQKAANLLSHSKIIPVQYQNNMPDCAIAIQMAVRLDSDVFTFMQNSYVVGGKPGIEAKFAIGLVNTRGPFTGPIQWRFSGVGKDRACTAFANLKKGGAVCEITVTQGMVDAEGWASKSGSKWKTMPEMMFRYRSAMFLARLYCPEVLMGMNSTEELEDLRPVEIEVVATTPGQSRTDSLAAALNKVPAAEADAETKKARDAFVAPAREPGDEDPAATEPEREMLL